MEEFLARKTPLTLSNFYRFQEASTGEVYFPSTTEGNSGDQASFIYVESGDGAKVYRGDGRLKEKISFPHEGYFVDAKGSLFLSAGEDYLSHSSAGEISLGKIGELSSFLSPRGLLLGRGEEEESEETFYFFQGSPLEQYNKFHLLPWGGFLLVNYSFWGREVENSVSLYDGSFNLLEERNFTPEGNFDPGYFDSFLDGENLLVLGTEGVTVLPLEGGAARFARVGRNERVVSFASPLRERKFVLELPGEGGTVLF